MCNNTTDQFQRKCFSFSNRWRKINDLSFLSGWANNLCREETYISAIKTCCVNVFFPSGQVNKIRNNLYGIYFQFSHKVVYIQVLCAHNDQVVAGMDACREDCPGPNDLRRDLHVYLSVLESKIDLLRVCEYFLSFLKIVSNGFASACRSKSVKALDPSAKALDPLLEFTCKYKSCERWLANARKSVFMKLAPGCQP